MDAGVAFGLCSNVGKVDSSGVGVIVIVGSSVGSSRAAVDVDSCASAVAGTKVGFGVASSSEVIANKTANITANATIPIATIATTISFRTSRLILVSDFRHHIKW